MLANTRSANMPLILYIFFEEKKPQEAYGQHRSPEQQNALYAYGRLKDNR